MQSSTRNDEMERKIIKYSQVGKVINDIIKQGEWRIELACSNNTIIFPHRMYSVQDTHYITYADDSWSTNYLLIDNLVSFKSATMEYFIIHA